jgi:signal transduction histidine kinase
LKPLPTTTRLLDRPIFPHAVYFVSLALLTAAAWSGHSPVALGAMMSHLGAVLLWQPLLPPQRRLHQVHVVLVLSVALLVWIFFSPWLLMAWTLLLVALTGTYLSALIGTRLRAFYAMGTVWLTCLLLFRLTPELAGLAGDEWAPTLSVWSTVGLTLGMGWTLRPAQGRADPGPRDYLNGTALALLLAVVWLGALVLVYAMRLGYGQALPLAMTVAGVSLFVLGWLQAPQFGWSSPFFIWSQYFTAVGRPLENWLQATTEQYDRAPDATAFVQAAAQGLVNLAGVVGVRVVRVPDGAADEVVIGRPTPQEAVVTGASLTTLYYLDQPATPSVRWGLVLAARVLDALNGAKRQQQAAQAAGYMEAIHMTGARLTHDVKNLLQSLDGLIAAASMASDRPEALAGLVQRQLPGIADRLRDVLARLKAPQPDEPQIEVAVEAWWKQLRERFAAAGLSYEACDDALAGQLPELVFTQVAENLILNALRKCRLGQADAVQVCLHAGKQPGLSVEDNGVPVPEGVRSRMFESPITSDAGFGIGLYHAARLAEQQGYRLRLTENRQGCVRFELAAADR